MATDGWLWPEGATARWWTPAATGALPLDAPGDLTLLDGLPALRAGRRQIALTAALAPELGQVLASLLEQATDGLRLHLSEGLPLAWQRFPFEYLHHQGQPAGRRLQVIRHAPRTAAPPVFPRRQDVLILDLWPDSERLTRRGEPLFRHLIDGLDSACVLRGFPQTQTRLERLDLTALSLLAVICHGSEGQNPEPFRLADGHYWSLPLTGGLPPLVALLACGSDERFNLIDYGVTLLRAGAQTVLAPVGKLDARPAERFLRRLLHGWQAGQTVAELLRDGQQQPDSEQGAGSCWLLGQGDLHRGPARAWRDQPDPALAAAALADDAALQALLERITQRCFQHQGDLDTAVDELYEVMGIDLDDREPELLLLRRLDALREQLPPLTLSWAGPFAAYLAEVYDHALLPAYQQLESELAARRQDTPPPACVFHHWGKVHYRLGRYGKALAAVAQGCARLHEARLGNRSGVGLLGLLVNGLIDLDLPGPGLAVYDRLDACLSRADNRFAQLQELNRLDRRARLALRLGLPEQAVVHYQRKRAIDPRDPDRELAGLLYAAAWLAPAAARPYAAEVAEKLRAHPDPLANLGRGSETVAYLLRAYALWAWRAADREAAAWLAGPMTAAQERLPVQDPGPFGLALGYLHLYQREHPDPRLTLLPWEAAEAALESFEYWFELAALSSLLGRRAGAERFLNRFQAMRAETLPSLEQLPAWVAAGQTVDWRGEAARRREEETAVLLADEPPAVARLVSTGLLPL